MLQQILTHTPIWVWGILAFLLYRGLVAGTDREMTLKTVFVIPLVMLGLSLQGIVSGFGAGSIGSVPALAAWFLAAVAGTLLAAYTFDRAGVRVDPLRRTIFQRGSWMPLLLMMGIFCTKYAVGVALALQPALAQHPRFALGVCALYGLFNGIFFGRMWRVVTLYRQACMPRPATSPA